MKKIVFAFILVFATIVLMAQHISNPIDLSEFTVKLDSIVAYNPNNGLPISKKCYHYDAFGNTIQRVTSEMVNGKWQFMEKTQYTYDENSNQTSYSYATWENNRWIVLHKIAYVYDEVGHCVFMRELNLRDNIEKTENTYDENGNCTERTTYLASNADTLWEPYNRYFREYDDWGKCLQIIYFKPNGNEWFFFSKTIYTYDDCHNLTLQQDYLWDDDAQTWNPKGTYTTYEYNTDNYLLRRCYHSPESIIEYKREYNEHNQIIKEILYNSYDVGGFSDYHHDTTDYIYNERGYLTRKSRRITYKNAYDNRTYLYEYERDAEDRIVEENYTIIFNYSNPNYNRKWKNYFTYDQEGHLITKLNLQLNDSDSLINQYKLEYGFGHDGNLNSVTGYNAQYGTTDWIEDFYFINTFDASIPATEIVGMEDSWTELADYLESHESNHFKTSCEFSFNFPMLCKWQSSHCLYVNDLDGTTIHADLNFYYSSFYGLPEALVSLARIHNIEGGMAVECEDPADIVVYDMLGRIVAQKRQVLHSEFYLTPGIYVVKVDEMTIKVVVN